MVELLVAAKAVGLSHEDACKHVEELLKDRERLEKLLSNYEVIHQQTCRKFDIGSYTKTCTCGLDNLLSAINTTVATLQL